MAYIYPDHFGLRSPPATRKTFPPRKCSPYRTNSTLPSCVRPATPHSLHQVIPFEQQTLNPQHQPLLGTSRAAGAFAWLRRVFCAVCFRKKTGGRKTDLDESQN